MLQLANVHLAGQGGNVLIVLIARLRLGDRDLPELGRVKPRHLEFGNVAAELIQSLHRPRAHHLPDAVFLDAVFVGQKIGKLRGAEQAQR